MSGIKEKKKSLKIVDSYTPQSDKLSSQHDTKGTITEPNLRHVSKMAHNVSQVIVFVSISQIRCEGKGPSEEHVKLLLYS